MSAQDAGPRKPNAAPLPPRPGTYWLRVALIGYRHSEPWDSADPRSGPTWEDVAPPHRAPQLEWLIGRLDESSWRTFADDPGDMTIDLIGSDESMRWDGRGEVVVEVGPEILPPGEKVTS